MYFNCLSFVAIFCGDNIVYIFHITLSLLDGYLLSFACVANFEVTAGLFIFLTGANNIDIVLWRTLLERDLQ